MKQRINKTDTRIQATAYGWTAILMGLPFLSFGGYFSLAGFGFIPLAGKANAPLWVIGCVGLAFFLAGAMVGINGVRGVYNQHRAKRVGALHIHEPWFQDYPWESTGIHDQASSRWLHSVLGTALLATFLAPFHWWGFLSDQGPFMVKAIVVIFDLVLVYALWRTLRQIVQFLKYGYSRLRFRRFPYHPGDELAVDFSPNRGVEVSATLRFVEECFERSGSGDDETVQQVSYSLHSEKKMIAPSPGAPSIPIVFQLPEDPAFVNGLSDTPVRYWELVLEADVPGIDFRTTFPLPVYAHQDISSAFGE